MSLFIRYKRILEISKSRQRTLAWQRLADSQTLQITNQAEARKKEGPVLLPVYYCKWLFLWFELSAMWLQSFVSISHEKACEKCSWRAQIWLHQLWLQQWGKKYLSKKHIAVHHGVSFKCHICQYKNDNKDGHNCYIKKEHIGLRNECHR